MGQYIRPKSKIKIIPREGELEIILSINITIDGELTGGGGTSANIKTQMFMDTKETKEEENTPLVPDFTSGVSLNFGKKD